jgi:hypothetical protein
MVPISCFVPGLLSNMPNFTFHASQSHSSVHRLCHVLDPSALLLASDSFFPESDIAVIAIVPAGGVCTASCPEASDCIIATYCLFSGLSTNDFLLKYGTKWYTLVLATGMLNENVMAAGACPCAPLQLGVWKWIGQQSVHA